MNNGGLDCVQWLAPASLIPNGENGPDWGANACRGASGSLFERYQQACDRNNRQVCIVAQNRSINYRQKGGSNISFNNLTVV